MAQITDNLFKMALKGNHFDSCSLFTSSSFKLTKYVKKKKKKTVKKIVLDNHLC